MDNFQGQKVIVTGATRGIGRAIAGAFLARGATVFGIYARDKESAAAFAEESSSLSGTLRLFQCDIGNYEAVEEMYRQIEEEFETIDILINNAGIRRDGVVAMMSPADWHQVINTNLTGTFNMSKHAVLLMMKQKYGRIIHITSPMSYMGFAGQANYAASKAGQIGMMRSLAKETAKRKITVNCVSPGFIDTELLADLSDEQLTAYRKMVPLRRFGTTEEVAAAVLFLAGPSASYITGSVLEINGGL